MIIGYPVKKHTVSQDFGRDASNDPKYKDFYKLFDFKHCGVDFPVEVNSEVYASFSGIVVRKESHIGMGNVIGIRNGNIVALYAHMDKILVNIGNVVRKGNLLGYSGSTGDACPTPHLHFEVRDISKKILKEMVFNPVFNQKQPCYSDTFTYVVNNKNTKKTLEKLSLLYFGTTKLWKRIKLSNNFDFRQNELLKDKLKVTIPNYK